MRAVYVSVVCFLPSPRSPQPTGAEGGRLVVGGQELDREESRKARMLYDYDAVNSDEISINAGEVSEAIGSQSKVN